MAKLNLWRNFKEPVSCFKLVVITMFTTVALYISPCNAQSKIAVTGTIMGESGQQLQGVTITEKNTSNATSTDKNGAFAIAVSGPQSVW